MARTAIYCRISRDVDGDGEGVDRQLQDCQEMAKRLGLDDIQVFIDNDVSASTSSRKPRPEYDRMVDGVRAGAISTVLAYSNSRLTRRPRELETWIDLHRDHGIVIKTCVSGEDDLSTADGRQNARIRGTIDAGEAERTSERLSRKWKADAEKGKPRPGRYRSYGYSRAYEPIPDEAEVVVEIYTARAQGRSFTGSSQSRV